MTQPTVDVLAADLEPLGPWPPNVEPFSGTPHAFGLELSDDGHVQTGIWECTPGSFPSRRDGICELMHFVAGDATITDADGTRHEIRPGVVRFFPDGWSGTWEIRETVRKTYAIVRTVPRMTARDRIRDQILVGDGGMGSLLSLRVPSLACPEEANLAAPEQVVALHTAFINAGADVIQTNTYGANRVKLGAHRLEHRFEELNELGAKLAREAREVAGRDVLLAGSIGPLGVSFELLGASASGAAAHYGDQAAVLAGRGVDLIVLETFSSLEELLVAIAAVRAACALPVAAELTVGDDGETISGDGGPAAARQLAAAGVDAIGVNCSLGPQSALTGLRELQSPDAPPLWIQPNAGMPLYAGGRVQYPDVSEEYFAEFAAQALALGARLVGGCCGTQPPQIAAVRRAVDEHRAPSIAFSVREPDAQAPPRPALSGDGILASRLAAGDWVLSVELDPPKGANLERLTRVAVGIRDSGLVDVFDVNDNPLARARMSSLMTSTLLQQSLGVETIPHLTPRDSSVRGLESQLLGAHATGIRNLLAVTGDYPTPGDQGGSDAVYQVDSIGLVEIAAALNGGRDHSGKAIDAPTGFCIGVAVNPTADDLDAELERFQRKIAAGAQFAMTQVLFDLAPLRDLIARLGGRSPVPLLVGLWPVTSHALALRLHHEVPGITIPEEVLERFAQAGADVAHEGVAVCRDLLAEAKELVAGAYLVPPFGQPELVLEVLAER